MNGHSARCAPVTSYSCEFDESVIGAHAQPIIRRLSAVIADQDGDITAGEAVGYARFVSPAVDPLWLEITPQPSRIDAAGGTAVAPASAQEASLWPRGEQQITTGQPQRRGAP